MNSFFGRLFLASIIILPIFIALSGSLLLNAFRHSQINAEQEKLQSQIYLLLSVAEIHNQEIYLPPTLAEPRFNQQGSGLYGFIFSDNKKVLWQSASSNLLSNPINTDAEYLSNQTIFEYPDTSSTDTSPLVIFSHDVEWFNDQDEAISLRFVIARDATPMEVEYKSYRQRLWQGLSLMGLLLLTAQLSIMLWGLRPLQRLRAQLQQLKNHAIAQLSSHYPKEIQPAIDHFNDILLHEKQQRERYRNAMADLAHSLKTPLAVIQTQLENQQAPQQQIVQDQVDRINQIITHQLNRAVIRVNSQQAASNTHKVIITTLLDRLIKVMEKVYQDKNIQFHNQCHAKATFLGDEADLLEVLGNVLDNACKYGKDEIIITASHQKDELHIMISDNGPGVPESAKENILLRGERADTAHAGQGLGLNVAVDIISSYGGEITVTNNQAAPHLSGACFHIVFFQR